VSFDVLNPKVSSIMSLLSELCVTSAADAAKYDEHPEDVNVTRGEH